MSGDLPCVALNPCVQDLTHISATAGRVQLLSQNVARDRLLSISSPPFRSVVQGNPASANNLFARRGTCRYGTSQQI